MIPSPSATSQCGWSFHTLRGNIDMGGPCFRPQSVGISCRYMEGFVIRGYNPVLPWCGGTATLARGATLASLGLHEPQPNSNHPFGLGFPHLTGRPRSGDMRFHPRVVGDVDVRNMFYPGMRPYPPRVWRDLDVVPRGNSSRALAP